MSYQVQHFLDTNAYVTKIWSSMYKHVCIIYIYIYTHIYIYAYVFIYIYIYIHEYTYMHTYIHTNIHINIYICIWIHIYSCFSRSIFMYVYMCLLHVYIHIFKAPSRAALAQHVLWIPVCVYIYMYIASAHVAPSHRMSCAGQYEYTICCFIIRGSSILYIYTCTCKHICTYIYIYIYMYIYICMNIVHVAAAYRFFCAGLHESRISCSSIHILYLPGCVDIYIYINIE